ncbi:MAG: prepilin-type N-terminal cleavage/methylation domain-containing protein [Gammaproteobacteria bacterium]|nr:prepilin-type N-terminal cleavage/methylation domain-containing protein [Gammaproteobacteria bacterium]
MIHRQRGITMIELMVVVVVVALLASIALPSYTDFVTRSRRSEAMNALVEMANLQERFFSNSTPSTYTSDFTDLPYPTATENGMYQLSIVVNSTLSYTLTATPIAGTSQAGDGALRLNTTGIRTWDKANDGSYGYSWTDR